MTGYLKPHIRGLPPAERKVYRLHYCSLCKTLKRKYGVAGMACLSYEMTVLLLLLTALDEEEPRIFHGTCSITPVYPIAYVDYLSGAFRAAADVSVILAQGETADNLRDGGSWKWRLAGRVLQSPATKARCELGSACDGFDAALGHYYRMETEGSTFDQLLDGCGELAEGMLRPLLRDNHAPWRDDLLRLARQLGRWVYLMDAVDDWEEDQANGNFNLLRVLPAGQDPNQVAEEIEGEIAALVAGLPLRRYHALVENLLGESLRETRLGLQRKKS